MKLSLLSALLFHTSQRAIAHYVFSYMIVNGTMSEEWQYVRNVTAGSEVVPPTPSNGISITAPNYDLYSDNIRCGRDGHLHGKGTQTATVVAGSEIGMRIRDWDHDFSIYHPGPANVYLSKSPTPDLDSYTGDGDWVGLSCIFSVNCPAENICKFKIKYFGPLLDPSLPMNMRWEATGHTEVNFTIPLATPPGKYLLRVEQIYRDLPSFNSSQFYLNCAQIEIVGDGIGKPGPLVKFPGAYDYFEPSLWPGYHDDLATYVAPGPPVWKG